MTSADRVGQLNGVLRRGLRGQSVGRKSSCSFGAQGLIDRAKSLSAVLDAFPTLLLPRQQTSTPATTIPSHPSN